MTLSPLGPSKRVYLGLAAVCLVASAVAQWRVERGRREAFGPPRPTIEMVELWPVLAGGFRGPVISALAYIAQEKEVEADIYTTRSTIRALIKVQPELDNLWIYYSWVVAYNLVAVVNTPQERYTFIRDGADFLEEGIKQIADLYEGRKPYVNVRCPITNYDLDPAAVTDDLKRTYQGLPMAFADYSAVEAWDHLNETDKAARFEAVHGGTLEYRRKRATLLYMAGWTYFHKMSKGEEARDYYRPWFIRDTGQDTFQVAYRYMKAASAIDVPPYQVSYHVLKTSPVHCLAEWARALAEDPKVDTKTVADAFVRASKEWVTTLPSVTNQKLVQTSVRETELAAQAMEYLAAAEERASVNDTDRAEAALSGAKQRLDRLFHEQGYGAYFPIYEKRFNLAVERVRKQLAGELP